MPGSTCAGWINSKGKVAKCAKSVSTGRRRYHSKYHSKRCAGITAFYKRKGLQLGDSIRKLKTCIGWAVRDRIVVECGARFQPSSNAHTCHSERCKDLKEYLRRRGLSVGDAYVKYQVVKTTPAPRACEEWVVRDSIITECGKEFTPSYRDRGTICPEHTSTGRPCNRFRWQRIGYKLGDSISRKCAYRNCTNPPFDRIQRAPSNEYYCPGTLHRNLEGSLRKWEQMKRILASRGGRRAKTTKRDEIVTAIQEQIPRAQAILKLLEDAKARVQGSSGLSQELRQTGCSEQEVQVLMGYSALGPRKPASLAIHLVAAMKGMTLEAVKIRWKRRSKSTQDGRRVTVLLAG